ncbi:aldehyde dehydrogenase family protein [soil metagenome]
MNKHALEFYIGGRWVKPSSDRRGAVISPASELPVAEIALGSAADVDLAVAAARGAFERYAATTPAERLSMFESIIGIYTRRLDDMALAISTEMGAPIKLARRAQAMAGLGHLKEVARVLKDYAFDEMIGGTLVTREPIGVCGLITPWNWPMNQIACKVGPALAAGCTVVLKPSELAPLSALLFAEILDEAGVPAGVFNLVNGDGATVGDALSRHPGIDMVSFTGSNAAGVAVAKAAADSVKRVHQELGGKSPNIVLDDADLAKVIPTAVRACFLNSGQSCDAPTRLLVPEQRLAEVLALAAQAADGIAVGDPAAEGTSMGPVVSARQFARIQGLIEVALAEGATALRGGPGRPDGMTRGFYVRPTVLANVRNDMRIAQEEVFGPVLCVIGYTTEDEAVRIANDTIYGRSSYVSSSDPARARAVARRLRAGMVHINGAPSDFAAPFGGYKASGNGREWGRHGLDDFTELKSVFGYAPTPA